MLKIQVASIWLLYFITVTKSALFQATSLSSSLSSNFTLVDNVTYDLNFSLASQPIAANSYLTITFSDRYLITTSTLSNCRFSTNSASSLSSATSCTVIYFPGSMVYQVTMLGVFPSTGNFSFLRLNFVISNPYAQFSEFINITIYNQAGTMIGSGTASITSYRASVMTGCSIQSTSMLTGANATQNLQFTPLQRLLSNSYLIIQLPIWSVNSTTNQVTTPLICTGIQGTNSSSLSCSIGSPLNSKQSLNITTGLVSTNRTSSTVRFTINALRNPWSVAPFGPIKYQLMYGTFLTQACYNIYNTVTNPNLLSMFNLTVSNFNISAVNTGVRTVFINVNPFPRPGNQIMLQFPSSLTVSYTGSFTIVSQSSTHITLSGLTSTSVTGFAVTTPPSTRMITVTLTTYVVDTGVPYAIQTRSMTMQNVAGNIISTSISLSNSEVNAITTYTILFTISNRLIVGSFINVVLPSQLNIQNASASCSMTGHTCSIISTSNITVNIVSTIVPNTALTITITNIKNANEALTTNSFAIYTYYDSQYDSLVDLANTGITVNMTPKLLSSGSVIPANMTNYAITNYEINLTLLDPIPIGGYIRIQLPATAVPQSTQLTIASFSINTCTTNILNASVITLTGCFTSDMVNLAFSITLSNILNPPSLKPSSTFKIYTYGPVETLINYLDSNLIVTMNIAATTTSFTVSPSNNTVGSSTTYFFQISHSISPHSINDYARISIPSLMTIPLTPSCTATSGITTVNCVAVSSTLFSVKYITAPSTTIQFSLAGMTNYLIGDQAVNFALNIFDSDGFLMQTFAAASVTYTESTLTTVNVNNDNNIALGQLSNITLSISNSITLYASLTISLTQLDISIPTGFTIGTTCTTTVGTCSVTAGLYRITNVGLSLSNLIVTLPRILLNYYNPISASFGFAYTYNGYNVSARTSGVTLSRFCTSPCQRCSANTTTCQSCLPSPNLLIYHDNTTKTCALSCVGGRYADANNQCQPCSTPCANCFADALNCTSCITGRWLYQNTCLVICPSTYYNHSNGQCTSCPTPCLNCTSATRCIDCATGYYSNNWCVNASSCPTGTYANTTTMVCQNCQLPCTTCFQSQNNCTSCRSGYLYYNNICTPSCPPGMYQSTIYCYNCTGQCTTCTSPTFCTSCLTNFVIPSTGICVNDTNCPVGTYANTTNMRCQNCPSGCTSCTNSTYCTSCNSLIFLFYNYGCYAACPTGTYQSGITCASCSPPCLTCRGNDLNCTSCVPPKLYYRNSCYDICPGGSYNNNGTCTNCLSSCLTCSSGTTCDSCTGSFYYENGQCVTQCSASSYRNNGNNTCIPCSAPCASCSISSTNCTSCIAPQVEYQNICYGSCPAGYFAVRGSCVTCPNCANCLTSTTCQKCISGYYLFNGVCYTTCPSSAPIIDVAASTCGSCENTCLTCVNTAKNCSSCYSGTYLYKGTCLTTCPTSFIQDPISGTCKQPLIGNIIYFPFSFALLFFLIICIASKCTFPQTENITSLGAIVSLCQFASWCVFAYISTVDYSLQDTLIPIILYVSLSCVVLSIGVGFAFSISIYKQYQHDKGLLAWKQYQNSSVYAYRVVNIFSCCSFRFFRFLYSRLFNRTFFSMYIADGERFLTTTSRLTFTSVIANTLPMIGISVFVLYKKQIYDQTFFCALDTLILGFIAAVLLTIDSCKNKDYFDTVKAGLPFLKYKNMMNDDSIVGQTLLSRAAEDRGPPKSQVDAKQKEQIFKKINWLPNKNKFGHLNIIQLQADKDQIKSLPQYNKLGQCQQFDPYQNSQLDRVVDDGLYFLEQQRRKQKQQQQELQRKRKEQQQEKQKLLRLIQQQQQRKRIQQERRKRQLMEEDERERVQLQFPDLAAIDKVENKNGKNRKNPLDLLSNCKKIDDKIVDDKALKKLQQIGKKNGIDPNFMKQTFGVEKNHNPQLLNQIIDKHNHVKRQSIKQLFKQENNQEILQQLFGKNSKMDPKKLREILNDPDSATLIKKLVDKQNGIVSAQICKQLFEQNSKYTKEFTKNLLSQDNGMDPQKLKKLLKEGNIKGKDSPLKALKKIGGQNLQNTQLLNNMMGQDSLLNPEDFTRVANDLSIKAIENLFLNKSKNSGIITSKILNNKKINLKNLAPILEDQQLLHELAEALGSDNINLQQNLINLFKNAQNINPVKLKQMLSDPTIRQNLLSKPVDPTFLQALISKNSKSDLKILSNALKQMSDESIAQTFKFDPEKNTDFKNLAELFDKNAKTDPVLVSKMLQPDMVKRLYVKGNDTKMLNKLVQKGNQFDPEIIKNVYGDQRNNIFDTKTDNMFGGNNQMNLINFDQDKGEQFRSQKQYSLGFQKNRNNQINMSRTAGGVLSFLTPIVPINNNLKNKNGKSGKIGFNQTNQDGWTSQGDNDQYLDEDQQIGQQQQMQIQQAGKIKRKKKGKKPKKKLMDIRHPAEQIYLQRIQAPHQHAVRKASIRKKKKKIQNPGVMDEDNDIFDMDF